MGRKKLDLTGLEFDLLLALVERKGRVVKRQGLMEMVGRDGAHVLDRTMDVHISHLRQKIAQAGGDPQLIRTVRGVGYILSVDDEL